MALCGIFVVVFAINIDIDISAMFSIYQSIGYYQSQKLGVGQYQDILNQ